MSGSHFPKLDRVDAYHKVTGQVQYAADFNYEGMLHAMTVPSTIAKGRVINLKTHSARQTGGVIAILTAHDFPPGTDESPAVLSNDISFLGQPLALVVAESLEAATLAAERVEIDYQQDAFFPTIENPASLREDVDPRSVGDAATAYSGSVYTVDVTYETPVQHHNPIELISTVALWFGGKLTIYESTQSADMSKGNVVAALGLNPADVEVKSAYIGGGFGQKGLPFQHTPMIAQAAMMTGKPVKYVIPRGQIFHVAKYRPRTQHHVQLGCDTTGKFSAIRYDVVQENTPDSAFAAADYHESAGRLYGIEHYHGTAGNIRVDRQASGFMRGTHPHPTCFAIESAVDELAVKINMDPVALRLANDTVTDPLTGRPMSSRFLNECLTQGADRFGWENRSHLPGSMTLADGTMVGWGVASGIFPASMAAGEATLRVYANGTTVLMTSGHEMGQGIRTALASAILKDLDIDPTKLDIRIGDTTAGPQFMTAGQWGSSSAVPVTSKVVRLLKQKFSELANGKNLSGSIHQKLAMLKRPYIEVKASELAPGQSPSALEELRQGGWPVAGPEYHEFTSMSYIAHFVEVHIEPHTKRIRVPRVTSVADCGSVISAKTALSQMYGGVVWGLGQTLREKTEIDARYGGYLNCDLAEYVVPVNADIGVIDAHFIDKPDPLCNSLGAKGLGELVMIGIAPAIANAVYHATGKRLRSLPIRLDDLLI